MPMNYLLYVAYIIFFVCLFLTNEFMLAYNLFVCIVAPLALMPIWFQSGGNHRDLGVSDIEISFINPVQTLSPSVSFIFSSISVFGLAIVVSSSITPSVSFAWFQIFLSYLLAISLFVLITARLSIHFDDFTGAFFTCFCSIVAINAAINIYIYIDGLNHIADFGDIRLSPSFGRAPDRYFTTAALSYAVAFSASVGLLLTSTNLLRKIIGLVSALILFAAICLTQSRGPLFASLTAIIVTGLIRWNDKKLWLYLVIPVVAISVFMFVPQFSRSLIARADNHRLEIWNKFVDFALERPILGYGERLQISLEISNGERLGHAHNIFISSIMRGGLIAFAGIIIAYLMSVANTIKLYLRKQKPIPLIVIITILVSSLFDFDQIIMLSDWQWSSFWLPLGLALGAECVVRRDRSSLHKQLNSSWILLP